MKNATPVVAFEGGPSDTIKNNETGFVVESGNIDEFAKKTIDLLQDFGLNEGFSKHARIHVQNNFSIEKSFTHLESMFHEVVSRK